MIASISQLRQAVEKTLIAKTLINVLITVSVMVFIVVFHDIKAPFNFFSKELHPRMAGLDTPILSGSTGIMLSAMILLPFLCFVATWAHLLGDCVSLSRLAANVRNLEKLSLNSENGFPGQMLKPLVLPNSKSEEMALVLNFEQPVFEDAQGNRVFLKVQMEEKSCIHVLHFEYGGSVHEKLVEYWSELVYESMDVNRKLNLKAQAEQFCQKVKASFVA